MFLPFVDNAFGTKLLNQAFFCDIIMAHIKGGVEMSNYSFGNYICELREKKGLAYTVRSSYENHLKAAVFSIYISLFMCSYILILLQKCCK